MDFFRHKRLERLFEESSSPEYKDMERKIFALENEISLMYDYDKLIMRIEAVKGYIKKVGEHHFVKGFLVMEVIYINNTVFLYSEDGAFEDKIKFNRHYLDKLSGYLETNTSVVNWQE